MKVSCLFSSPREVIAGSRAMKSSKMKTILQLLLLLPMSEDCLVQQSGPQTVDHGSSVKLNCTFSLRLHEQKLSLIWIKIDQNKVETTIFPIDSSADMARFHVDSKAFQISQDAGILLRDLRGRDSGRYVCSVSVLHGSTTMECRGAGTYLTVRASVCDTFIACCPLGVFIAALLVLHGMVYKQWMEYRNVDNRIGKVLRRRPCVIHHSAS